MLTGDFKEDLSEEVTFELRPEAWERDSQAREASLVGRSEEGWSWQGNCKGRVILSSALKKKIREVCMAGQHGKGENQGGWWWGGLWGLNRVGPCGPRWSVGFTLRVMGSHGEFEGRERLGYDFRVLKIPLYAPVLLVGEEGGTATVKN